MSTVATADVLIERSREQLRVDARRAAALAEEAAAIAEQLGDGERLGKCFRARANALSVAGDNRAAADWHAKALQLLETHGSAGEVARTLAAAIQPLILLGEYDRALASADRARQLYESIGDERQLARLDINVGNLHHRQDRGDEALEWYERAYPTLLRLGDADGLFMVLHNKAVTLITLHRFREAEETYLSARALATEQQRPLFVIQADYNVAWLYYLRGEYSRAIELLHGAADSARQNGDAYHAALCLLDLSEIYLELNLSADAMEVGEEAVARFCDLGMPYEHGKAIVNTAIAHGQGGRLARAMELFAEARALFAAEKNDVWASLADLYQALLLFNEGRLFEARRLALAAAQTFLSPSLASKRALCELLLARISLRLDDARGAREACQRVLRALEGADRPILRYHAHFLQGQADTALGDRAGALASYQAARGALESLRSHVHTEELKIAFAGNKLEVYEYLLELSLEEDASLGERADAFRWIEEAKSRTLLDLIFRPGRREAQPSAGESEIARSIRALREELNSYYHLIEREQLRPGDEAPARIARLQRDIGERERTLTRVLRDVATREGRDSEWHAPHVCSVEEIRHVLPEGATLIEFFQTHDRIMACVVDEQRVEMMPVALVSDVTGHVRLLQFQLSKFRLGEPYVAAFGPALLEATRAHLKALFDELLAPIWPMVRGRHLVVVPHGMLHSVPFHALIADDQYVCDTCSVSYAPSASIYALCERQASVSAGGALVLGIPDARAPFIEAEARQVGAVLPGARLLIGETATAAALREHGRSSRIIHIASHGYFRPDRPMFSGVRLADGYLNVHDLYQLELPADLVTLSGCATGANVAAAGDELLGISRGLFLAGARRLLLSFWDVPDGSTARLMTRVYGLMATGTPVVQALGQTMQEIRRETPHPYYWAPFGIWGKGGAA